MNNFSAALPCWPSCAMFSFYISSDTHTTIFWMFSVKMQRIAWQAARTSKLHLIQAYGRSAAMQIPRQNSVTSTKRFCAHMGRKRRRQTLLLTTRQPRCHQTSWHWLVVSDSTYLQPNNAAKLGFGICVIFLLCASGWPFCDSQGARLQISRAQVGCLSAELHPRSPAFCYGNLWL